MTTRGVGRAVCLVDATGPFDCGPDTRKRRRRHVDAFGLGQYSVVSRTKAKLPVDRNLRRSADVAREVITPDDQRVVTSATAAFAGIPGKVRILRGWK